MRAWPLHMCPQVRCAPRPRAQGLGVPVSGSSHSFLATQGSHDGPSLAVTSHALQVRVHPPGHAAHAGHGWPVGRA